MTFDSRLPKISHLIILFAICLLGFGVSLHFTTPIEAQANDAQSYLALAEQLAQSDHLFKDLFIPQQAFFVDSGYAVLLSFVIKFFPQDFLVISQLVNYLLWGFSSCLVYFCLRELIGQSKAKKASLIMALSPVFLTFPAKLYSETLAAFSVSLIIYSLVFSKQKRSMIYLFLGSFILVMTKSIFLPFIIVLFIFLLFKKKKNLLLSLVFSFLLLFPIIKISASGGRSQYTLAVQTAKLESTYSQNLTCIPYNLSFPLGKLLFPRSQNICILFEADPQLSYFQNNPVEIANNRYYSSESFSYLDALSLIIKQPTKYVLIIFVDIFNLVFVEGFYSTVLLDLPTIVKFPLYVYGKLLSIYLWYRLYLFISVIYKKDKIKTLLLLSPLLYFILFVSHFHLEPRYFYPFLPWLYFLTALKPDKLKI